MRINVVTIQGNWILKKIAERIVANAPEDVDMVLTNAARHGQNNFYVDVTNCYWGKSTGKDVGLFTHVHENSPKHIKDHWFTLDHIIHMSRRSYELFGNDMRFFRNLPAMSVKMPGEIPSGFNYQKPTIGVFQRGKYEGKGYNFMVRLADEPVAADFEWVFAGNDWDMPIKRLKGKTHVAFVEDNSMTWPDSYKMLYNKVDFVLVPSKWEGGPMALIEAAALGKTIIAPGVGWVNNEIPVDHTFAPGNEKELAFILESIVQTRKKARKVVERLSYEDYSRYVADVFRRMR